MRKIISVTLLLIMLITTTCLATTQPSIKVVLNGEDLTFDQPPVMRNNRVYVPIRIVSEKLGATVEWNPPYTVKINDSEDNLLIRIGTYVYDYNNMPCIGDAAPFIENGRTLVPVRLIAQTLNCDVDWNQETQTVIIETNDTIEDSYNDYKTDKNNPLVYDALKYESGYRTYVLPKININHPNAEAINERILLQEYPVIDSAKKDIEAGCDPGCYKASYKYFVFGNILSIVGAKFYDGDNTLFFTINYDLEQNIELTSRNIIELSGNDTAEHTVSVQQKLKDIFKTSMNNTLNLDWMNNEFFYDVYNRAGSDECYNQDSPLYINSSGCITAVVDFPSIAGADSYMKLFDTGAKINSSKKSSSPIIGKWYYSNPDAPIDELKSGKVTTYLGEGFESGCFVFKEDGTYQTYTMWHIWYTDQNGTSFYDGAAGAYILTGKYTVDGNTITLFNETESYPQHAADCNWVSQAKLSILYDDNNLVVTDIITEDDDFKKELTTFKILKR